EPLGDPDAEESPDTRAVEADQLLDHLALDEEQLDPGGQPRGQRPLEPQAAVQPGGDARPAVELVELPHRLPISLEAVAAQGIEETARIVDRVGAYLPGHHAPRHSLDIELDLASGHGGQRRHDLLAED